MSEDRRAPGLPRRGGRRATDPPPLSTRECANYMGVSPGYIRDAIHDGHLKAECIEVPGRRALYRVKEEDFVAFLQKVKWSRIPNLRATGTQ